MQMNSVIKLGLVALLSVTMAACSSTEEEGPATTAAPASGANTSGAGDNGALSAAEQEAARLRAITTFYFEFDKSDLSAEARDALVVHANDLKANPSRRVRLEGHADERGTREYNLALGERRSQAVERYLQVQGVAANQLEIISYGEEQPVDAGTSEAAYSKNRRVEMKNQ
ncbi:MAG: peptidoglycan-associated lipoprotein [Pseudomonadota bacterium]|jgi:peptidoglycan-associated lipoprotein